MGRKMKLLPSLFRSSETGQPWQWPSCKQPKTLSFRATDDIIKTVNSVYFDPTADEVDTPESWFTNSSESASFSTESEDWFGGGEAADVVVIRGVQSERLFFKPGCTSSILEEAAAEAEKAEEGSFPFEESVAVAMESEDPYVDFRRSMEEMVETHGLRDWERLEELLGWYLKVNGKVNHGLIIGAFVDLLVGLASSSSSDAASFSSAASSFSDPPSPMSASDRKEVDDE